MVKKLSKKKKSNFELENNQLQIKYEVLKKKYSLPSFKELNEEFDISKVDPSTETILRDIRKGIISKFFSILSFIELLINPSNGSMFYMYLVRGLDTNDKEKLKKLFDKLGYVEIKSFKLDIEYSEKGEAEFIKNSLKVWNNEIQQDLSDIIKKLDINWSKISSKKERSYFGWFYLKISSKSISSKETGILILKFLRTSGCTSPNKPTDLLLILISATLPSIK